LRFGTPPVVKRLLDDCRQGFLIAIWNTEIEPSVSLELDKEGYVLRGAKRFASGVGFLSRAVVTARLPGALLCWLGSKLTMPRARRSVSWRLQGMRATATGEIDLTGLAIRKPLYLRLGGLPPLPVGEDRAMFDAVRSIDGKIRHSLAAQVEASARTVGRANGGMADALRTRGTGAYMCDKILEPALLALRRARLRGGSAASGCNGSRDTHQPEPHAITGKTILARTGLILNRTSPL
jgi:alkylation response protein AidB-like acyl-CoA dehydrogenase